mmetsp:Transcript_15453/g.22903  ORF Transcript_15453/g.22903 Transcript_15453/m.22903 type:complete len:220 (+) Transcript_15453:819-1478(+)
MKRECIKAETERKKEDQCCKIQTNKANMTLRLHTAKQKQDMELEKCSKSMEIKQRRTIGVVENPADMNGMNPMNMHATHPMGTYNPNNGFGGSYGYNNGMLLNNWQSMNNSTYTPFANKNNGYAPAPSFGGGMPAPFPNNASAFHTHNGCGAHQQNSNTGYGAHQQNGNNYMHANMNPMNNMHTTHMNDDKSVSGLSRTGNDNTQETDDLSQSNLDEFD